MNSLSIFAVISASSCITAAGAGADRAVASVQEPATVRTATFAVG